MRKNFFYAMVLTASILLRYSMHMFGQDCSAYRLKTDLGFIVFRTGSHSTTGSLEAKLELLKQSEPSIQWRIPDQKDLEIMKKCPKLTTHLTRGVYYWTRIKVGLFYQCIKIDENTGQIITQIRLPSDGANGVLIGETIKPGTPTPVDPSYITYRVKHGNYLSIIARSFKQDISKEGMIGLGKLNKVYKEGKFEPLKTGQILKIPIPQSCPNGIRLIEHPVKNGETLWKISDRYLNKSFFKDKNTFLDAICTWNGIINRNRLKARKKLILYLCKSGDDE